MEDEKNKKQSENAEASSSKPSSSVKQTPKSLTAKQKIVKNSLTKTVKMTNIKNSTPQAVRETKRRRIRKKISAPQENKESSTEAKIDAEKINTTEQKVTRQKHVEKDKHNRKNKEKVGETGKKQPNHKNKEKGSESHKTAQHGKYKGKQLERIPEHRNGKDKLGGIIFMCNAKTKPDVFRYHIMGITKGKKDLVLAIKPGMKLFLYDFDLKLMYGIYKASSSGGMQLEPTAFGGAFPVQVRFEVHRDCYPLPENVFKNAFRENYNERNKFNTNLTIQQVKRLMDLFQPAEVHSAAPPIRSPHVTPTVHNREMHERGRDLLSHTHTERRVIDPYVNGDTRNYHLFPPEMEPRVAYREVVSSGKQELPNDSFLTENEYRTYGLQGQRHMLLPSAQGYHEREQLLRHPPSIYMAAAQASGPLLGHQSSVYMAPPLESGTHLGQPPSMYRVTAPESGTILGHPSSMNGVTAPVSGTIFGHPPSMYTATESVQHDPFGLGAKREMQPLSTPATATTSSVLDSYHKTPYNVYGSTTYTDQYLLPVRREDISSGSYLLDGNRGNYLPDPNHLQRYTDEQMRRAYLTYGAAAVPGYNPGSDLHQGTRAEPTTFPPVSSRYSFAGPSSNFR